MIKEETLFEIQCIRCDGSFNIKQEGRGTTMCPHCNRITTYFVYSPEKPWDKDISKEEQKTIKTRLLYSKEFLNPIFTTIFHTDDQKYGVIDFLKSINPKDTHYDHSYLSNMISIHHIEKIENEKTIIIYGWDKNTTENSQIITALSHISDFFIINSSIKFKNCAIFFLVHYECSPSWIHSGIDRTTSMNYVWLKETKVNSGAEYHDQTVG